MKGYGFIRKICICLGLVLLSSYMTFSVKVNKIAKADTESRAECVIEAESRRIVYESHGDKRLPMASTTKILTALTVLETCEDLQEKVTIPKQAEGIEGSSVYLKSGEIYTVEDLLYGMMLRSGNDCACALAYHCSGSIGEFAARMNGVAQKAGAIESHFSNPHGLPCENHYTTARDLAYITALAMENPCFRGIVATEYYQPYGWKNKNKLLFSYEDAIGVKTGYTKEAGRCLVSAAKKENTTFISVVLGCGPMYERSETLLRDAFGNYRQTLLLGMKTLLPLQNGQKGCAKKDIYYPLMDGEESQLEIKTYPNKGVHIDKDGEIVGQFEIYLSKRLLFSGNLYKL